jgi:hypothetical protein
MRRLRRKAHQKHVREHKKFKQRAIAAGAAVAITLGTAAITNKAFAADPPDLHHLPVSQDADTDLLADTEEAALAYLASNPDQNRNTVKDGVELARLSAAEVNDLPWQNEAGPNETYKWWAPQFGVETCDICGATLVMGPGGVVNPQLGISVQFPFLMTLHYMEHGSFSYAAHYSEAPVKGRADVAALLKALDLRLPYEPNDHQLPVPCDADSDLLANKEETAIGYQVFDPDQNRNEIPDGVELAKRCCEVVKELPSYPLGNPPPNIKEPYKIEHALDGLERCYICGQWIHMGGWEIVNPKLNLHYPDPNDPLDRRFLPDLALHYMGHGSFDCYGDIHKGRVEIDRLIRVLELRFPYDPNEHQLPLDYVIKGVGQLAPDANDYDGDLLADTEELAANYNLYNPDQDEDLNPDGIELSKQSASAIDALPVYDPHSGDPPPKDVYKIRFFQRGLELCEICGEQVNMGYWQIINPKLGLSIDVYDVACHYMSHGSFSYSGLQYDPPHNPFHNGRTKIALLVKILEMPKRCGDLGTIYLPGDLNKDCKVDFKDFAEFANQWLGSTDPNDGGCNK